MQVFWEFIRADKENGNVFHKVSNHKGTKVKDAEISNLLVEVQTQLHKVFFSFDLITLFDL